MSRFLLARACSGALGMMLLLSGGSLNADEPAGEAKSFDNPALQRAVGDANVRFAHASLRVAEAELAQAQDANKRVPGTISPSELRRLALNVERVRAQLEVAAATVRAGGAVQASALALNDAPGDRAIRQALEQKTSIDFSETPLVDAVEFLSKKHGIQIVLDGKSLDDAGIGVDTLLTQRLSDISLRSALNLLLKPLDMTFVIRDEVLSLTTIDQAGNSLETVVYDARDLLDIDRHDQAARGIESPGDDFDSLIDAITTLVYPTSWDSVGGPGSIAPLYRTLAVNQTQLVHEEIAKLLAVLRKIRAVRGETATSTKSGDEKSAAPADPNALTLRMYRVSVPLLPVPGSAATPPAAPAAGGGGLNQVGGEKQSPKAKETQLPDSEFAGHVAAAIEATVQLDSWSNKGGPGVIRVLPPDATGQAVLVVRQTAGVHQQIDRFLKDLQSQGISRGFGGGGLY